MGVTQEDLLKKIEETELELAELKAAQRVLERLGEPAVRPILDSGSINIEDLESPVKPATSTATLAAKVEDVVRRFDDQEFTVSHVAAALNKIGKGSNAKHFRNRLSSQIRKLTDDEMLTRTYKGAGREPHRYRLAAGMSVVFAEVSND